MRFLVLFAFVSAASAFPRAPNLDYFESLGPILEDCVTCIEVQNPQHQVLMAIYTNIHVSCENQIEGPDDQPTCKKDASKYCRAAAQVLGEFWFKLPNVNNCCGTEMIRTFVKSCAWKELADLNWTYNLNHFDYVLIKMFWLTDAISYFLWF